MAFLYFPLKQKYGQIPMNVNVQQYTFIYELLFFGGLNILIIRLFLKKRNDLSLIDPSISHLKRNHQSRIILLLAGQTF